MTIIAWHGEPVSKHHGRETFDCGEEALNEFLRRYARRNHQLGSAKTFLAVDDTDKTILGFYSLSLASVEYARTPKIVRHKLPRYEVPVFRLARLAVDRRMQGQGLGGQLLARGWPALPPGSDSGWWCCSSYRC